MLMRIALLCALSSTSLISIAARDKMNNNASTPSDFMTVTDQFMKESLALSPVNASNAGYHNHTDPKTGKTVELDALLDDVGPKGVAEQLRFYRDWQKRFRKFDPAKFDAESRADLRLVDDQISYALLELEHIQSYKHNPTAYVELIGNALFLPMSQNYAPADVRLGHVLSRIAAIPRAMQQAKEVLVDTDPIYTSTALDENEGNIDLIEHTVKSEIPAGSPLLTKYSQVAPVAIAALKDFSQWMQNDLAKRKTTHTWRLGKEFYPEKFRLLMETPVTPDKLLARAEHDLQQTREEMLQLALPLHKQMYPDHSDHADLKEQERENTVISEVLAKIADDHVQRGQLLEQIKSDIPGITEFIREKKLVTLSDRNNLKVIPTPLFMRGIYSVAGFHAPPPLEPNAEGQYWVTPIPESMPEKQAESKLREYNNYVLKWLTTHEALPGHYVQFEHANNVQPQTRRLVRALFGNGPYIEGWAVYCDSFLMPNEGYLNHDPKYILSVRKIMLRVIANTILDIRMHTMNMSDQEAMDLMLKQCFQTQAEAEGKLRRAKLSSVQLPTYYTGYQDWLALRRDYEKAKGSQFNLLEFNDRVLDEGPLPILYLREVVLPGSTAAH